MTKILEVLFSEGSGERLSGTSESGTPGYGVIRGSVPEPLHHGMREGEERWSFATYQDQLYFTNGAARPRSWDGSRVTSASPARPLDRPTFHVERIKTRVRGLGASAPDDGFGAGTPNGTCRVSAATTLSSIVGWSADIADVGKTVVLPSTYLSGGPDYLGTIAAVNSASSIEVTPALDATQQPGAGNDVSFMVFETPLAELEHTTPYHARRLIPQGGNVVLADQNKNPAGAVNDYALRFQGGNALRVYGQSLTRVGRDVVLDFKALLWPEEIEPGVSGRIVIADQRSDSREAAWELSIVGRGQLEFRFWDTERRAWRSIRQVGQTLSPRRWHLVRLTYRFKGGGGWQADQRWYQRNATAAPIVGRYRDRLDAMHLEGTGAADPLLIVPGSHSNLGLSPNPGTNVWAGRSWAQPVLSLLEDKPEFGPRENEPGYFWPALWTLPRAAVSFRVVVNTVTLIAAGPDAGRTVFGCTMLALAAPGPGLWLHRAMSTNRDIGAPTQAAAGLIANDDIGAGGANYYPAMPAAAASARAAGVMTDRAVLAHVYGEAINNPAAQFVTPRILAIRDIGNTDLGAASQGGSETSTLNLIDSPGLGADGGGGGAITAGLTFLMSFQLPNGRNHAPGATGNTKPFPGLMRQGELPVGEEDSPTEEGGSVRIGGTVRAGSPERGTLGFSGMLDDVGFSIRALSATSQVGVYTGDMLPPDPAYRGACDLRFYSAAQTQFLAAGVTTDVSAAGQNYADASWASRFETPNLGLSWAPIVGNGSAALELIDDRIPLDGEVYVAYCFMDPDQRREGPLSELIRIKPEAEPIEDEDPADAGFGIRLEGLAVSGDRDRARLWRVVYRSVPGTAVLFREQELRDNRTSTVLSSPSMTWLRDQPTRPFASGEPPICRTLVATESRMVYGGLAGAPNAIAWSDAERPWSVPLTYANRPQGRAGRSVTALAHLLGRTFVFQEDATFVADFVQTQGGRVGASIQRIDAYHGCAGPGAIVDAEDGICFLGRAGVFWLDSGLRPIPLGVEIEPTLREKTELARAVSGYDRRRRMALFGIPQDRVQLAHDVWPVELPGGALDQQGAVRWTRLRFDEGVSSIVGGEFDGLEATLIGSPSGHVSVMRGTTRGLVAASPTTGTVSSSSSLVVVATAVPVSPTGWRMAPGTPVLFLRTTNAVCPDGETLSYQRVIARGAVLRSLEEAGLWLVVLQDPVAGVLPNDAMLFGSFVRGLTTSIIGLRGMARQKRSRAFDLLARRATARLGIDLYLDRQTSPSLRRDQTISDTAELVSIPAHAVFHQVQIECTDPVDLVAMSWRLEEESQHA